MRLASCVTLALLLSLLSSACGTEEETQAEADSSSEVADVTPSDVAPDAAADADPNDGSTSATDSGVDGCYYDGFESEPKILWVGPQAVGPCEGPCYYVVEASVWDETAECLMEAEPMFCLRVDNYGTAPTFFQIPEVGIVMSNYHPALILEYGEFYLPGVEITACAE